MCTQELTQELGICSADDGAVYNAAVYAGARFLPGQEPAARGLPGQEPAARDLPGQEPAARCLHCRHYQGTRRYQGSLALPRVRRYQGSLTLALPRGPALPPS